LKGGLIQINSPGFHPFPQTFDPSSPREAPAASALLIRPNTDPAVGDHWNARVARGPRRLRNRRIWGTPTPVTMRVVQIEPGPMPTSLHPLRRAPGARAIQNVATLRQ